MSSSCSQDVHRRALYHVLIQTLQPAPALLRLGYIVWALKCICSFEALLAHLHSVTTHPCLHFAGPTLKHEQAERPTAIASVLQPPQKQLPAGAAVHVTPAARQPLMQDKFWFKTSPDAEHVLMQDESECKMSPDAKPALMQSAQPGHAQIHNILLSQIKQQLGVFRIFSSKYLNNKQILFKFFFFL